MSKSILEHLPKGSLSPLWIIGSFVSIVETVVTVAIIQTTGLIQGALTAFAILFAFYIATLFFIVLWNKNHVFYGPAEFNQQDPSKFVVGMQSGTRDDKALLATIDEAVRKSLTSGEIVQILQTTQGEAKTNQILERTASRTIVLQL